VILLLVAYHVCTLQAAYWPLCRY